MTLQEILDHFHALCDDDTTLSEDEEVVLANKAYRRILGHSPWEFLRTPFSVTQSTSVDYIDLPADFKRFVPSGGGSILYVGAESSEWEVVAPSRSVHYSNTSGYSYLDMRNRRLVFTRQPTEAKTVRGWYIYRPDDLTLDDEPVFDAEYHLAIAHGMMSDYYASDGTPKGRTYYQEHEEKYDEYVQRMLMDNALLATNNP